MLEDMPLPAPKRRLRRWLCLSLAVLLLFVWFAPVLIARTSLLQNIARGALSELRGELRIKNASLGWFSPVVLEGVEVSDESGTPFLAVERVETERTLLGLLFHTSNPGVIRCERPTLDLVVTEESSNVEKALAEYLKPTDTPSSSTTPNLSLQLTEAKIRLRDSVKEREWNWHPVELSLQLDAQGLRVSLDAKRLDRADSTLAASMAGDDLNLKATDFPLELLDTLARRLDLGPWSMSGSGDVVLKGHWKDNLLQGEEISVSVRDAVCEGPGLWLHESELHLTGKATLDTTSGRFAMNHVVLRGPSLTARLADASVGNRLMDLQGNLEITGNVARLRSWLTDPKMPPAVPLRGTLSGRLSLHPSSTALEATTSLTLDNLFVGTSWQEPRVNLVGAMAYHPENESLRFTNLLVTTADIRGKASGRLDSSRLLLERGTGFERTRLTPRMTSGVLQYAIPALAGAAEANGEFSLLLESAALPLEDPTRGQLSGQLTIHAAKLTATAPLIRELSALVGGRGEVQLRGESRVSFKMENGRVYHEGLEIVFPESSIKTSGWVGLDGNVSMIAEMPIPPRFLGTDAVSQSLRKQLIRVPITGTLASPKLDQGAIREASARVAKETAKDVIEKKIEKKIESGLQKLIRPKK